MSPDRAAIPALLNVARNDPEFLVRHAAVRALGAAGPEAVDGLIDLWRRDGDEEDRTLQLSAADSLVAIAKPAVPALVSALGDPSWRVRWMAIGALTRIGNRDALSHVRPLVDDPHSMVRDAAREAMPGTS
jgi:HEAT repeat protein